MNKRYAELNANLVERLEHQLNINENLKVSYVNSCVKITLLLCYLRTLSFLTIFSKRQKLMRKHYYD